MRIWTLASLLFAVTAIGGDRGMEASSRFCDRVVATSSPVQTLVSLLGPGEFSFAVEASETGQFAFEHLAASRYRLAASTDAGRVSHDVTLGEDEINANVVLVLDAGRRISGTVNGFRPEHRDRIQVVAEHESKPG